MSLDNIMDGIIDFNTSVSIAYSSYILLLSFLASPTFLPCLYHHIILPRPQICGMRGSRNRPGTDEGEVTSFRT